jgi:hypothetical protein
MVLAVKVLRVILNLAVAENQPANKHRMNKELSSFAARLRETVLDVSREGRKAGEVKKVPSHPSRSSRDISEREFSELALELFDLQFQNNAAYRKICEASGRTPKTVEHWMQIPAVPTAAFKELELTSLAPEERTAVFHSSGTTEQKPSRHFHNAESLAVYETALWAWFEQNVIGAQGAGSEAPGLLVLTPPPEQAPNSSLIHMFETVRKKFSAPETGFVGQLADDGAWALDFDAAFAALNSSPATRHPSLLLGTAFSFVHLLDYLTEKCLFLQLPPGSRVMETGGYKNRSRALPKQELHALITERLGVSRENIVCEYGMSELSSQAYENVTRGEWRVTSEGSASRHPSSVTRHFSFPPWARAQIISPETGREVADGETGLIRIFDLANVFSVAAILTEDLGVRSGDGFELVGRARLAEPRGCSLMTA